MRRTSLAPTLFSRVTGPGYTDRWFIYRERPPYMVYLRHPDGSLNTFGSVDEAAAWLGDNPYVLPDP